MRFQSFNNRSYNHANASNPTTRPSVHSQQQSTALSLHLTRSRSLDSLIQHGSQTVCVSVRTKAERRERKSIILLHSQPKGRIQSSFARHGRNHKRKRGEMNNPVLSCDENRGFAILHVAETNAIQRDSISVTVSSYGHSLGRKSE